MLATFVIYWPGLSGSWLFDDYPNIVDNHGVQPPDASMSSLMRAALSSPSSELKRPLASLSFALNYLAAGLDPYWMKLTNLVIHLLNGLLVFVLARMLLLVVPPLPGPLPQAGEGEKRAGIVAALIAAGWMLLPINLTAVLYVVQRMESMANLFVLAGLIGYVAGRCRMLGFAVPAKRKQGGLALCIASLTTCTAVGVLAKETAVMLPLYAFLVEWAIFHFDRRLAAGNGDMPREPSARIAGAPKDWRIVVLFVIVLVLPMLAGLGWLLPNVLNPSSWATRDFTLGQRLLSEARIVCDYIAWTLLPTPHALSFYHDQFPVSTGLLKPWTTLASMIVLAALAVLACRLRRRQPLAALGLALFLGCQLLTGTILPLELVYEHRNYFASFGLLLVVVPWLAGGVGAASAATGPYRFIAAEAAPTKNTWERWGAWGRHAVLAGLMLWWAGLTAVTAYALGDPLRLAEELAMRAPDSPRAQYELGRTYIMYSHYDPSSPYTKMAYAPLERAAAMPESSILPQQALIFMNSRMRLPLKDTWWDSMIAKLKAKRPGVQDESSLLALTQCARDERCDLPHARMIAAFEAALGHPSPSARLLATYGDYAWNVLGRHDQGERLIMAAVRAAPDEPAYRITLVRMLLASGRVDAVTPQMQALQRLDIGGRLDGSILNLRRQIDAEKSPASNQSLP